MKFKLPHASSKYGAQMGRPDSIPIKLVNRKFYLNKLKFVDGCHDQGGAYWGCPANVYWAHNGEQDSDFCQMFFRANNREHAKTLISKRIVNASFFN